MLSPNSDKSGEICMQSGAQNDHNFYSLDFKGPLSPLQVVNSVVGFIRLQTICSKFDSALCGDVLSTCCILYFDFQAFCTAIAKMDTVLPLYITREKTCAYIPANTVVY